MVCVDDLRASQEVVLVNVVGIVSAVRPGGEGWVVSGYTMAVDAV